MLFDHVPEARMPETNQPPSEVQDLLEEYRMAQARYDDHNRQMVAEGNLMVRLRRKLVRELRDGERVEHRGITVTRIGGGVSFRFDP